MRYHILGATQDIFNVPKDSDESKGFDLAKMFSAAGSALGDTAASIYTSRKQAEWSAASAADANAKLQAAIAADRAAKDALGQALYSTAVAGAARATADQKAQADADQQAYLAALQAATAAGALVPLDYQGKRLEAAQAAVKSAVADYQQKTRAVAGASNKAAAQAAADSAKAYYTAAQKIAAMVANAQMRAAAPGDVGGGAMVPQGEGGFLSRNTKIAIGVGAGVLALGGLVLLLVRLLRKR